METFGVICLILAYIFYRKSARNVKPITWLVFLYFLLNEGFLHVASFLGVLEDLGDVYYLMYSLFSIVFVVNICLVVLTFTQLKGAVSAFICALTLFLISIVNTGVHWESVPMIFEVYFPVMLFLESILLAVCFYSSGVLSGVIRFLLGRNHSGDSSNINMRCDIIKGGG